MHHSVHSVYSESECPSHTISPSKCGIFRKKEKAPKWFGSEKSPQNNTMYKHRHSVYRHGVHLKSNSNRPTNHDKADHNHSTDTLQRTKSTADYIH